MQICSEPLKDILPAVGRGNTNASCKSALLFPGKTMVDLDMTEMRKMKPRKDDKPRHMSRAALQAMFEALTEEEKEKVLQAIRERSQQQSTTTTATAATSTAAQSSKR